MRGTPYCYYGDELGMTNIDFNNIEQYRDVAAINSYRKALSEGKDMELFMKTLNFLSRDNGRTPMQWNDSIHAGFTTGTPWLPVNDNFKEINVKAQDNDPNSVLNYFRKMIQLRKENPVLVYGDYELLQKEHPDVYAFTRSQGEDVMLIALNFTDHDSSIELPQTAAIEETKINNYNDVQVTDNAITLKPYQAVVFSIR